MIATVPEETNAPDPDRPTPGSILVPTEPRSFRLLFIVVTSVLVGAAFWTSIVIYARQNAMEAVSSDPIAWRISQAGDELSGVESTLADFAPSRADGVRQQVKDSLDLLDETLESLRIGQAGNFIAASEPRSAALQSLRGAITRARVVADTLATPEQATQLLAILSPLNADVDRLAAAAHAATSRIVYADLSELSHLHWIFSGVLGALVVSSFALIILLTWHNRLLIRAHQEVNELVADLKRTGGELAQANGRAHQAMEEVQLQNQILQARDNELIIQNARFDAALNNMSQALCMVDANQRLIVCNLRFLELFGLSAGVVQPGTQVADVFRAMAAIGRYPAALIEAVRTAQQALVFSHGPGRFLQEAAPPAEGQPPSMKAAIAVSHQPMVGGGWVATYEDVTERRHAEARIQYMTHHDALTSLPNRSLFHERMAGLLAEARRPEERLAVLCLDLDYFKNVNDTLGHPVGDALLEAVAERLRQCGRPGDVVARLGGDEFALLQIADDQPLQAELLAQRVVEVLGQPYDLNGERVTVTVSIGIALATERGINADLLLRNADMARYRAKADGRSTYRFFATEMDAQMQARRTMEIELREVLARDELEVHYQPIFNLSLNQVTGFEALLRWNHATMGTISPAQFIPIAEELGLIEAIGAWVLQQACRDATTWPDGIKVAVNLSPVQVYSATLVDVVAGALAAAGLAAERLELEITESALLRDNETVLGTLHKLRGLGLRTALDDFGTGYSSLSYLRSFPFDKLKIDQSFVREMAVRPDCLVIVNSVADLARQLGITTTAEGVETAEQLAQVRAAGCAEAQGYYFDGPQPAPGIRRWFVQGPDSIFAA